MDTGVPHLILSKVHNRKAVSKTQPFHMVFILWLTVEVSLDVQGCQLLKQQASGTSF